MLHQHTWHTEINKFIQYMNQTPYPIQSIIKNTHKTCVADCGDFVLKSYVARPVVLIQMLDRLKEQPVPRYVRVAHIHDSFETPFGYVLIFVKIPDVGIHPQDIKNPWQFVHALHAVIQYIHSAGIHHRDIHYGNLSFDGDTVGIIDFDEAEYSLGPYHHDDGMFSIIRRSLLP
jgi:hypothetical protein